MKENIKTKKESDSDKLNKSLSLDYLHKASLDIVKVFKKHKLSLEDMGVLMLIMTGCMQKTFIQLKKVKKHGGNDIKSKSKSKSSFKRL